MKKLFEQVLDEILSEQETSTDDIEVTGTESVYTPEQQKFLAHFGKTQNNSLGVLYSMSPAGIQEFINRSGAGLNLTIDVLIQLIKAGVVSIVPYTGYSRNVDYTIACNVPLEGLAAFSVADDDAEETPSGEASMDSGGGDFAGGGGMTTGDLDSGAPEPMDTGGVDLTGADVPEEGADVPDDGPEESFRRDGTLLFETTDLVHMSYTYPQIHRKTAKIANQLIMNRELNENFNKRVESSRVLKRLPAGYLTLLEKIIKTLSGHIHNTLEKEHLVADILDNLAHNFGLTPNQILKSYTFYQSQNRLKNLVKK